MRSMSDRPVITDPAAKGTTLRLRAMVLMTKFDWNENGWIRMSKRWTGPNLIRWNK